MNEDEIDPSLEPPTEAAKIDPIATHPSGARTMEEFEQSIGEDDEPDLKDDEGTTVKLHESLIEINESLRRRDADAEARRMAEKIREAHRRRKWRKSSEYRSVRKLRVAFYIYIALSLVLNSALLWLAQVLHPKGSLAGLLVGVAASTVAVILLAFALIGYKRNQALSLFRDRMLIEEGQERDSREAELVAQGETDIKELWKLTNERLRGYHERAYRQADQSFRNAQIAIFGGFVIIAGTAAIAAWKTSLSTPSSIVIGVVGTVGAGLAAYIGRTFLRLQETTASHMRSYFDQPQETFRYLVAEKLIERLPEDQRAATVEYLVQAVMLSGVTIERAQAALNAQQQNGQADTSGQTGGNPPQR